MENTKKLIGKNYKQPVVKKIYAPKSNSLLSALVAEDNKTVTENGAPTYKSTLNSLLDFFAMGGAVRQRNKSEVITLFIKALSEDSLLATKLLFHTRNIRGGLGEREVFKTLLNYLGDNYSDIVERNIDNIAHYGRYDDLFALFGTKSENLALAQIQSVLDKDVEFYSDNKPITMLGKWLPSENATSIATRNLGSKIRKFLGYTPKQYRKTLSALRSYVNVVEIDMSANNWSDIDYSKVPSKASLNYRGAFKKHDNARYQSFIDAVKKGEAKVNASALFPYEIVEKVYAGDRSEALDILWDNLPNYLEGNERNILCVCDVSGSMNGRPMATSISLGIYTAERNKGAFKDYFITYSQKPQLQKVIGNNIREKVNCLLKQRALSTDLQSVFTMLLDTAVKGKIDPEEMPEQVIVISDMEFNNPQNGKTNLETIKRQYKNKGYDIPQLVFWNVNSRKNNVAAKGDDEGVLLVSGSSPSVFKTLLTGNQYTPADQMLETLNQEIYNRVV